MKHENHEPVSRLHQCFDGGYDCVCVVWMSLISLHPVLCASLQRSVNVWEDDRADRSLNPTLTPTWRERDSTYCGSAAWSPWWGPASTVTQKHRVSHTEHSILEHIATSRQTRFACISTLLCCLHNFNSISSSYLHIEMLRLRLRHSTLVHYNISAI